MDVEAQVEVVPSATRSLAVDSAIYAPELRSNRGEQLGFEKFVVGFRTEIRCGEV